MLETTDSVPLLYTFIPILVLAVAAIGLAAVMLVLAWFLGPRKPTPQKLAPYECGVTPVGSARERFPVKFYLTAMLFIIFDVELVFMYPWAVTFLNSGKMMLFNLAAMGVFLAILVIGFVYEWGKGGMEWE